MELESLIRSDEHTLVILDLIPSHRGGPTTRTGPTTRAILKDLAFNASIRTCSQVLASVVSELSLRGQDIGRLVRAKKVVDSASEVHPVLDGNTTVTSIHAAVPTCSGSIGIRRQ